MHCCRYVENPAPPASDSHLDVSGFQIDGVAHTLRSYTNGPPTAAPGSIASSHGSRVGSGSPGMR